MAADAPPVIAKDTPAAPNAGKAAFRRLRFAVCFAYAIVELSFTSEQCSPNAASAVTFFVCFA